MPTKRDRVVGGAEIAGGTALATGTPAGFRTEHKIRTHIGSRYGSKISYLEDRKSKVAATRSTAQNKLHRSGELKRLSGQIQDLNVKRKAVLKPRVFTNQSRAWAIGTGIGVPLAWHGLRRQVEKRYTKRDVDYTMGGAVAGAGGYQLGAMTTKPLDWRNEKKISNDPELRAIQHHHQKKYLPGGRIITGNPANREYFRNYPKVLPGSKLKRTFAVTHAGRSGTAITAAVGAAGAYGGYKLGRKIQDKKTKVQKNFSAFGIEH